MKHTIYIKPDTRRSGRRLVYCSCGWTAPDTYAAHELANQAGERHTRETIPEATETASEREKPS